MKKKLFGNSVTPRCEYCLSVRREEGGYVCRKKGIVSPNGKCMRYKYDPTLREPKPAPLLMEYDKSVFEI